MAAAILGLRCNTQLTLFLEKGHKRPVDTQNHEAIA
jgi:hypothetical protein